MGTHPKAPSQVIDPDQGTLSLADWIAENPKEHLSLQRASKFANKLPYLFKVLSAAEALSIQAHPDKSQAERLHRFDPKHYPDDNHKPEVAIAIDALDALVGLLAPEDYRQVLATVPELHVLLTSQDRPDPEIQQDVLTLLKLWEQEPSTIESCITAIHQRLKQKAEPDDTERLFLKQVQVHGHQDPGLLFIFLLKRIQLKPGEAIFLPPGVPHAYLKGNIIECMANSDNVVRLGLTNKFCDPGALSQILNPENNIDLRVTPTRKGRITEYQTPANEFRVKSLNLDLGESISFTQRAELSTFLVLKGEIKLNWCFNRDSCCSIYRRGNSFIAPANLTTFTMQARERSMIFWVDLP